MKFMHALSFGSNDNDSGSDSGSPVESYHTATDIDMDTFTKDNVRTLLERHSGADGVTDWKLITDNGDEGMIWRGTVTDCSWSAFRVSRRIDAPKAAIEKALLDPASLMKLDEMMANVEVLHEQKGSNGRVTLRLVQSVGQFPTAPREFVLITSAVDLQDGRTAIASRSVDVQDVPVGEGHVRGINLISGYLLDEKTDSNGHVYCDVVLIGHADLSGYIPASIISLLGTSATMKLLVTLQNEVGNAPTKA